MQWVNDVMQMKCVLIVSIDQRNPFKFKSLSDDVTKVFTAFDSLSTRKAAETYLIC